MIIIGVKVFVRKHLCNIYERSLGSQNCVTVTVNFPGTGKASGEFMFFGFLVKWQAAIFCLNNIKRENTVEAGEGTTLYNVSNNRN